MRKTRIYILLACFFTAVFSGALQKAKAQDDNTPPPSTCLPTDPDYDPRLCVPIDGGLAFLLAAGVGYGILKNRSSQKKGQKNAPGSAVNE